MVGTKLPTLDKAMDRFLSTTVPRGFVEKMNGLDNNLSAHNMKMLIHLSV